MSDIKNSETSDAKTDVKIQPTTNYSWSDIVRLTDILLQKEKHAKYHRRIIEHPDYKAGEHPCSSGHEINESQTCNPDGYPCVHRIAVHVPTNECDDGECMICSMRDCPDGNEMHYDKDGCPDCSLCKNDNCPNKKGTESHFKNDQCSHS